MGISRTGGLLRLKSTFRSTRLTDNRLKCPDADFRMVGHGNRDRRVLKLLLHNYVTSALTDFHKSMTSQNSTNRLA